MRVSALTISVKNQSTLSSERAVNTQHITILTLSENTRTKLSAVRQQTAQNIRSCSEQPSAAISMLSSYTNMTESPETSVSMSI